MIRSLGFFAFVLATDKLVELQAKQFWGMDSRDGETCRAAKGSDSYPDTNNFSRIFITFSNDGIYTKLKAIAPLMPQAQQLAS